MIGRQLVTGFILATCACAQAQQPLPTASPARGPATSAPQTSRPFLYGRPKLMVIFFPRGGSALSLRRSKGLARRSQHERKRKA